MNYAQAKAAAAILERASDLLGEPVDELHLGYKRVVLDVKEADEYTEEGVEATLWRGGIGTGLILSEDGKICGLRYRKEDGEYGRFFEDVEITLRDDGTFSWSERQAVDA